MVTHVTTNIAVNARQGTDIRGPTSLPCPQMEEHLPSSCEYRHPDDKEHAPSISLWSQPRWLLLGKPSHGRMICKSAEICCPKH